MANLSPKFTTREVHMVFILFGCFVCEFMARALKHVVQQPRPLETCESLGVCASPGFPSSHTQLMFFLTATRVSMLLRLFEQKQVHTIFLGLFESVTILFLAAAVAWSRVYLGYHTLGQVLAAAAIGSMLGMAWIWLTARLGGTFSNVSTSPFGHWMNLKNSWGMADVLYMEYVMHCSTTKAMPAASKSKPGE
ncbi:phosphatidic acid phosphatase type 2/haloperoxidase [Dunaliella salina]|uniref:Phosphatidic acid phosphatase type 2/haloperoxidase n=1 Tax=Dunaliella salina TaxID=3046 RepID=A0ABQ7FSA2_DUNSA|nr:phosphatidic acid phosphatase type 2/haloperoxidase [Dunaliella salina]|eukprot:KAF5825404.1 phosphatidic acid phosphatase type 2/haloperoxidase [Dunaliella salina]